LVSNANLELEEREIATLNAEFVGFCNNSKRKAVGLLGAKTGHACPAENSQLPSGQQNYLQKPDIYVRFLASGAPARPPHLVIATVELTADL
jgi:hypothetical protein